MAGHRPRPYRVKTQRVEGMDGYFWVFRLLRDPFFIFYKEGKLVTMVDPGPLPSLCNLQKVNNKDRVMAIKI